MNTPTFFQIPEGLKSIVDGLENERRPSQCLQCRERRDETDKDATPLVRCSRCQVAHYCNVTCQKKHFDFHKSSCGMIFKRRKRVEEHLGGASSSTIMPGRPTKERGVAAKNMARMADELVCMGYRESDTIENGRFHYRKALYWYMELYQMMLFSSSSDNPLCLPLEDKLLFLIVLLGGNVVHMQEWCTWTQSRRSVNFMPVMAGAAPPIMMAQPPAELQAQGLVSPDTTFHFLSLFAAMRSLAQYRNDAAALRAFQNVFQEATVPVDDSEATTAPALEELQPLNSLWETMLLPYLLGNNNHENGARHVDLLPDDIRTFLLAMEYHGTKPYMFHVRDSIPLLPSHAPQLLDGGNMRPVFLDQPLNPHTPKEFWHLYQDGFFLTRGVNDILYEFVPERDDDYPEIDVALY